MYSCVDEEKDFDEQRYAIIVLCDDDTIWQKKYEEPWEEVGFVPDLVSELEPKKRKK
jgi:hypothetical protein